MRVRIFFVEGCFLIDYTRSRKIILAFFSVFLMALCTSNAVIDLPIIDESRSRKTHEESIDISIVAPYGPSGNLKKKKTKKEKKILRRTYSRRASKDLHIHTYRTRIYFLLCLSFFYLSTILYFFTFSFFLFCI